MSHKLVIIPTSNQYFEYGIPPRILANKYTEHTRAEFIVTEPVIAFPLTMHRFSHLGIYSTEQTRAWRKITEAAHAKNQKVFLQLWHCGLEFKPLSLDRKFPHRFNVREEVNSVEKRHPFPISNSYTFKAEEIPKIVRQFRCAAQNALTAEFDGVEIHVAFGLLIDWFFRNSSNTSPNYWGVDLEDRTELIIAVIENVAAIYDEDRVGIKLSPSKQFLGSSDPDPEGTFYYLIDILNYYNISYIHFVSAHENDTLIKAPYYSLPHLFRNTYRGNIILNTANNLEKADSLIVKGDLDLVSQCIPISILNN